MFWPLLLAFADPRVTIPSGTYSLVEAAKRLSTSAVTVEVSSSLLNRGLLLSINDRPQNEALEIVCKALDLRVKQENSRRVRLVPDEEVANREEKWRRALLQQLAARWSAQEDRFIKLLDLSPDELNAALRKFVKKKGPGWFVESGAMVGLSSGGASARAAAIFQHAASPELQEEILTSRVERDVVEVRLSDELAAQVQTQMKVHGPLGEPVTLQRALFRTPGMLRLNSGIFVTDSNGQQQFLNTPNSEMEIWNDDTPIESHLFELLVAGCKDPKIDGLGSSAEAFLLATDKKTEGVLSDATLAEKTTFDQGDGSISGIVEKWAGIHHRDIAMELAPIEEWALRVRPAHPESPKDVFTIDRDWYLDSVNGALVVKNRMAFLDRLYPCPIAEIAEFARICRGRSIVPADSLTNTSVVNRRPGPMNFASMLDSKSDPQPDLPTLSALLPLLRLRLDSEEMWKPWFGQNLYFGYHGLTDSIADMGCALLWPGAPTELQKNVLAVVDGYKEISVGEFDSNSIGDFVNSILSPDASEGKKERSLAELTNFKIAVWWSRRKDGEIVVMMAPLNLPDTLRDFDRPVMFQLKA